MKIYLPRVGPQEGAIFQATSGSSGGTYTQLVHKSLWNACQAVAWLYQHGFWLDTPPHWFFSTNGGGGGGDTQGRQWVPVLFQYTNIWNFYSKSIHSYKPQNLKHGLDTASSFLLYFTCCTCWRKWLRHRKHAFLTNPKLPITVNPNIPILINPNLPYCVVGGLSTNSQQTALTQYPSIAQQNLLRGLDSRDFVNIDLATSERLSLPRVLNACSELSCSNRTAAITFTDSLHLHSNLKRIAHNEKFISSKRKTQTMWTFLMLHKTVRPFNYWIMNTR